MTFYGLVSSRAKEVNVRVPHATSLPIFKDQTIPPRMIKAYIGFEYIVDIGRRKRVYE